MNQNSKPSQFPADTLDHLAVLEARAKNVGKRTYSSTEVRARLGLLAKR
jgi:hypothetical protein